MPLYEFKCLKCGKNFEDLILTPKDEKEMVCPKCGSKNVKKQVSVFATGADGDSGGGTAGGSCKPAGGG